MDLRLIGYFLIFLALMQFALGFVAKEQINTLKLVYMPDTCHEGDDPNTCPVLKDNVEWYIALLWVCSITIMAFGVWLSFISKDSQLLHQKNKELASKINKLSKDKDSGEKFEIFLKGLNEDEKSIMQKVKEQDGIGQNTLCIRTGLSKTKLSILLTELERRGLIRKVPEGKINRIYLKEAF
ncbi:hypothetical protein COU37_02640 [Candidatus Micrarchaeota archaeon CG10_big_fil_rev_8_21_14_0_10_45_29]|nr:MAG: hypothetical protein COU37_02640 [Candidatus Micrarchaeota archaeon CG10_big_fil_rev_8_21_14_0_10_45_29]